MFASRKAAVFDSSARPRLDLGRVYRFRSTSLARCRISSTSESRRRPLPPTGAKEQRNRPMRFTAGSRKQRLGAT
jgi:hypothetical protein